MQTIEEIAVNLTWFRTLFAINRRQAEQCKERGNSVTSETELREHEKTCKDSSGQQRIHSGMDSSKGYG